MGGGPIANPGELRQLPRAELPAVARELREHLIALGAEVGGHFAGSLGAVELTVALHTCSTRRTTGSSGTSGTRPTATRRSPGGARRCAGSSAPTARAASCAAARAPTTCSARATRAPRSRPRSASPRPRARTRHAARRAVAVIGDGAATAGMSFEALNHAGHLRADAARRVQRQRHVDRAERRRPRAARGDVARLRRARSASRYSGPVDGHDLDALLDALARAARRRGPGAAARAARRRAGATRRPRPIPTAGTRPRRSIARRGVRRASGGGPPSWTAAFADALARHRRPRPARGRAHRRDARRHRARPLRRAPSRPHVRRRDRRAARGDVRGRPRERGAAPGVRDLLELPPARLRPDRRTTSRSRSCPSRSRSTARDSSARTDPRTTARSTSPTCALIPNLVVAAPRDENELQHLLATAVESGAPFALRFPRGAATGLRDRPGSEAAADRPRRAAARRRRPRDRRARQDGRPPALAAAERARRARDLGRRSSTRASSSRSTPTLLARGGAAARTSS